MLRTVVSTLLVLVLAAPLMAQKDKGEKQSTHSKRDAKNISDSDLTMAVESRLFSSPAVLSYEVDVATKDGVVTLSGAVDNILAREKAGEIAENVKGVRRVENKIIVKPAKERSDRQIRFDVDNALMNDPATDSYEIDVKVDQGAVTLTGSVDSYAERMLAEDVAKEVRGVTGVKNQITVDYKTDRPDSEIASDIRRKLAFDARLDAGALQVLVKNGKVNLSGTVSSAAERTRAYVDAFVAGVKSVDTEKVQVDKWWDRSFFIVSDNAKRSDADIRSDIHWQYSLDPRVKAFNPNVSVVHGAVTLTGTVDNADARWAAEDLAQDVSGVRRVVNRLKVRPPLHTDDEVAANVRSALDRDALADRYRITVACHNGVITLRGDVTDWFERDRAEQVARGVAGVTYVRDFIDMDALSRYSAGGAETYWGWRSDAEIREDIKDYLWWSWWVNSDRVSVTVDDGKATLSGTVQSISAKRAAAECSVEGGATSVINNLVVDSTLY